MSNTNETNTNNNSPDRHQLGFPHVTPAYRLFLDKLVNARKNSGISTAELAKRLRLPESRVTSAKSGARPMSFLEVRSWCRALEIDLTEFTETLDALITAVLETPPPTDNEYSRADCTLISKS
ncbi:XRE family transcriptional regulator [bacterium]|nr:MAG: XRE family transcriptional regulator [bacterium]